MNLHTQDIVTSAGIDIDRGETFDFGAVDAALLAMADIIQELVNNTPTNAYVTFPEAMV